VDRQYGAEVPHLDANVIVSHADRHLAGGVSVKDGVAHDLRDRQLRALDPLLLAGASKDMPNQPPGLSSGYKISRKRDGMRREHPLCSDDRRLHRLDLGHRRQRDAANRGTKPATSCGCLPRARRQERRCGR
jgi:hypothetical protein